VSLPHEEFRDHVITAGLSGLAVSGITSPVAMNGGWWPRCDATGLLEVNGRPSYQNDAGVLYWSGTRYEIAATLGGTVLFTRATLEGTYAGGAVVAQDPVWPRRHRGDTAQLVLTPFRTQNDGNDRRWLRYPIIRILERRCEAAFHYFNTLGGPTNGAPGLTLVGWRARSVQVDLPGVVDALPITGGQLLKAAVDIHLLNVYPI
jgi:hypothetical protein